MTHSILGNGATDRRSARHSTSRPSSRHPVVSRTRRRALAAALAPALTAAGLVGASAPADATVTVGAISVFPDRDMVTVSGYNLDEVLTVEVLRNDVVVGQATGPAVDLDVKTAAVKPGLEVNHGPAGTAQAGDCWEGTTPNIVAGDLIRVTSASRAFVDTMTVADVQLVGAPVLDLAGQTVTQRISSSLTPAARLRNKAAGDLRARPPVTGTAPSFTATFSSAVEAELRAAAAAAWRADVDASAGAAGTEVTIAESDGVNGPAAGCDGGVVPPPPGDTVPGQTVIGQASAGRAGAPLTAIARWTPPTTGGAPTGYVVRAFKAGATQPTKSSAVLAASARRFQMRLSAGTYRFKVEARNQLGAGALSIFSNEVKAR